MKKAFGVLVLISIFSSAVPAFAESAHDACQKVAVSAALEEMKNEFPPVDARTKVDSIHEAQNVVTVEVENENISDLPLDITVRVRRIGTSCEVVGTPEIFSPDNS